MGQGPMGLIQLAMNFTAMLYFFIVPFHESPPLSGLLVHAGRLLSTVFLTFCSITLSCSTADHVVCHGICKFLKF